MHASSSPFFSGLLCGTGQAGDASHRKKKKGVSVNADNTLHIACKEQLHKAWHKEVVQQYSESVKCSARYSEILTSWWHTRRDTDTWEHYSSKKIILLSMPRGAGHAGGVSLDFLTWRACKSNSTKPKPRKPHMTGVARAAAQSSRSQPSCNTVLHSYT